MDVYIYFVLGSRIQEHSSIWLTWVLAMRVKRKIVLTSLPLLPKVISEKVQPRCEQRYFLKGSQVKGNVGWR